MTNRIEPTLEDEIWKDIPDYEGLYFISNMGNVCSLKYGDYRMLKPSLDTRGYLRVDLWKYGVKTTKKVHRLVWETFNEKTSLQVDHKVEGNKQDNRLSNLQAVSQRQNITKHKLTKNKSSQYTGVVWDKRNNRWLSQIWINKKSKYLGLFKTELEASNAYQEALSKTQQEKENSIYYPLNKQK